MMPPFIFINDVNANNSNQAVEELVSRKTDNGFEDTVEHTIAALTEPLDSAPKE